MILRASHTLVGSASGEAQWIEGGGVELASGKIKRVLESPRALARAADANAQRAIDLGDGLLLPGFVNAHAHLELSGMRLSSAPFAQWIGAILEARKELGPLDFEAALHCGESSLIRSGTTCVGDIASTDAAARAGRSLRSVVFRELLDAWDPTRSASVMERVQVALPAKALRREGLSPHAPYTTSSQLLGAVAALLAERPMPVSIHWAESRAEVEWLAGGGGELAAFFPESPRTSGLNLLEQAGLLTASTSLVHGNHPEPGDLERLARAGVVLVHCPGTHEFFGREPFPWEDYRHAGVPIALGTDSLASNLDLDMRREMALARAGNPALSPMSVLGMATHVAARALGMGEHVGSIAAGMEADMAFHVGLPKDPNVALEALTHGQGRVAKSYVAGCPLQ